MYDETGIEYYDQKFRLQRIKRLNKAKSLNLQLIGA
jgi:hypothetical protein